jgi:von Willebrand factor type A domain
MYPEHRLEVDVASNGKPVADAVVTLLGDDGETAWEARTNNKGVAYVYADLYDDQGSQDAYGVEVSFGDQKKRYENVPVPRAEALKIDLEKHAKAADALDLMLLIDTTGSMKDELNYLKTELKDVVKRVDQDNGQQLNIRLSANFYRDHGDDYVVKPFPFTDDIDKAVGQLAGQNAAGGGDFPEAVDEALESAVEQHEWSGDARARLLFLVMDAPPHHERKVTKRIKALTETAAAEGIRIIPVASSGVDVHTEYVMRFMAAATGGTYLFLTDHSGIGNDHLEPAVGEYEVKALNDLLVEVINRYAA